MGLKVGRGGMRATEFLSRVKLNNVAREQERRTKDDFGIVILGLK